jgi:hypothetical protein
MPGCGRGCSSTIGTGIGAFPGYGPFAGVDDCDVGFWSNASSSASTGNASGRTTRARLRAKDVKAAMYRSMIEPRSARD